jgi:surfeit locus 1 family protein
MPLQVRLGRREFAPSLLMTLLTLSALAIAIQLGRWQWHRADEKRALLASFAAGSVPPEPLAGRPVASLPRYARVTTDGQYLDQQFLLDNISRDGRAGYEVLTPLLLADGRTLLVNRGWIAQPGGDRQKLPEVTLVPGANHGRVSGRLDDLPVAGLALGHAPPAEGPSWPKLTSFPTSGELAAALKRQVEPRQLLLDADQPSGFQRDWQPANAGFSPERHLAYAVQWWGLGALATTLYLILNLRRS